MRKMFISVVARRRKGRKANQTRVPFAILLWGKGIERQEDRKK